MPTNVFFERGGTTSEKRLLEDLISENIQIHGHDCYYLPRKLINRDLVLNEDTLSKFNTAYLIEMYFEGDSFQGEAELMSKFGLEIREDTTFVVSKRRFEELVSDNANLIAAGRPNEGDLIYLPLMKSFFEILFVEDQEPFFQLNNLPVYKLRVTRFEYASEKIDTGISELDKLEDSRSMDMLNYKTSLEDGSGSLQMESEFGTYYFIGEEFSIETQSKDAADNTAFESEAGFDTVSTSDDILDFTERNPFGEVDEGF
jgi:hypothetical protein